jgi:hypothetical protein
MATLRAREPFSFNDINGVPQIVAAGDLFDSADRNIKGREHLFEAVEVNVDRRRKATSVEDATAEPGAKRSLSTTSGAKGRKTQGERQHDREAQRTPAEQKSNTAKLPTPADLGHDES